jgi:uncharacterized protein (UPF0147 family)
MYIRQQLQKEFSKPNSVKVALMVGANEELFAELMECLLEDDSEIARRAGWALSFCLDKHPYLFDKYVKVFVELMNNKTCHVAVKRAATQALQYMQIPEDIDGLAYDYGMNILNDPEESIAVKAYSLQILQNIVLKYPELKQELKQLVEVKMPFETPAFKSRGKKLLKILNK